MLLPMGALNTTPYVD